MKNRTAILAAALILGGAAGARCQVTNADVNVLVAEKFLDTTAWGPTNRQGEIGLMTNWQWRAWPVLLAADFLAASREAPIVNGVYTEQQARTFELDLGARKIWKPTPNLRPYAGGGLAVAFANIDDIAPAQTSSSTGDGAGIWLDGGIFWAFTEVFNLGFDARFSTADVRLFGSERDAGGLHFGLLAGYHFGG